MSDYDRMFKEQYITEREKREQWTNRFYAFLVAVVVLGVLILAVVLITDNTHAQTERLKARAEACKALEDQGWKTLCVNGIDRP